MEARVGNTDVSAAPPGASRISVNTACDIPITVVNPGEDAAHWYECRHPIRGRFITPQTLESNGQYLSVVELYVYVANSGKFRFFEFSLTELYYQCGCGWRDADIF